MGNGKVKVVAAAKFGGLGCVCSEHPENYYRKKNYRKKITEINIKITENYRKKITENGNRLNSLY